MADKEGVSRDRLEEEYSKTLNQAEEGGLVEGVVIQVDGEYVYLDLGLKSEGRVSRAEFTQVPQVGDKISCVLLSKEGEHGEIVVSKKKADNRVVTSALRVAFEEKKAIHGKITKVIKGGFDVDLGGGVIGFLPISKADTTRIEEPEKYVGLEGSFMVDRLSDHRGRLNVVVTRRELLAEENEKKRADFFAGIHEGDDVEGEVKSFTGFGVFVDLGGFDGLLHVNDMSWGHVSRPKDYVQKGQQLKLKVIRLDAENRRINLSLKHLSEDPWIGFEERYNVGDVVKGKVTKLADFGAFVELEEGIEGLVHISELSWIKRVKRPSEVVSIGDEASVMILGYDTGAERISLGLKQTLPNPWDDIAKKYPVGSTLERVIKKVTPAGAFVELEEDIDGFLHVDDISWGKRVKNAQLLLKEGETIKVAVVDVIPEESRIRLSMKELLDNPWQNLEGKYSRGEGVEGEVVGKTDFGVFVRVEGGPEGLIHKNNLSDDKTADVEALLAAINLGDKITASIVEIIPDKKRLSLSVRDLKAKQQRKEISRYMDSDGDSGGYTLGDAFKEKE